MFIANVCVVAVAVDKRLALGAFEKKIILNICERTKVCVCVYVSAYVVKCIFKIRFLFDNLVHSARLRQALNRGSKLILTIGRVRVVVAVLICTTRTNSV